MELIPDSRITKIAGEFEALGGKGLTADELGGEERVSPLAYTQPDEPSSDDRPDNQARRLAGRFARAGRTGR